MLVFFWLNWSTSQFSIQSTRVGTTRSRSLFPAPNSTFFIAVNSLESDLHDTDEQEEVFSSCQSLARRSASRTHLLSKSKWNSTRMIHSHNTQLWNPPKKKPFVVLLLDFQVKNELR